MPSIKLIQDIMFDFSNWTEITHKVHKLHFSTCLSLEEERQELSCLGLIEKEPKREVIIADV